MELTSIYDVPGLRYTDKAVLATAAIGCLHSLVAVQALVLCAYITPNQDLAFVLAVSYDVLSSLLGGVWVHIGNLVSLSALSCMETHLSYGRCMPKQDLASVLAVSYNVLSFLLGESLGAHCQPMEP